MIPSATALMSEPSRDSPIARALSRNSRDVLEEEEGAEEDDEEKAETNIYIYIWLPVISSGYEVLFRYFHSCSFCLFVCLFVCLFSAISCMYIFPICFKW
jgi:hypothetical protein